MEKESKQQKVILLVEDSKDDIFVFQKAYEEAGLPYPVNVVRSGQEAMDYLAGGGDYSDRNKYPLPFLAFVDLNLPLKNGFEVINWVRQQKHLQDLIIIALTSSYLTVDMQRAYTQGVNSYITKPNSIEQMIDSLRRVQDYWIKS